jgi:N-acetyl sugar amidotransferase
MTEEILSQQSVGSRENRCTRCVFDSTVPDLDLDARGVCKYCRWHDELERQYPQGAEGERRLREIIERIKADGKRKPYDVVVGISGGCDSSYMLWKAKEWGLRPLAVHFDNTWDSTIAVENIQNMLSKLDVDLFTYVVDNEEYDDIYRSFLKAGTRDTESPTDIALAATLNRACDEYGIKNIFEGHSFRTEGLSPLGWLYMDGRYIRSVQRKYGTRPLKTYPNMPMRSMLKWMVLSGITKYRPLYYVDYQKEEAKEQLSAQFGWKWYGGHHLENRFTAFFWTYLMPKRFGIDQRLLGYSGLVRSGQMERDEALDLIRAPIIYDPELVAMVKKRLGYSDSEFEALMEQPIRTYREFRTYKKTFERMRPIFWALAKAERIPHSFYMRYTLPDQLSGAEDPVSLPIEPAPAAAPLG